jgi:hypothetical protein
MINISLNGQQFISQSFNFAEMITQKSFSLASLPDGNYSITIDVVDKSYNSARITYSVVLDRIIPDIEKISDSFNELTRILEITQYITERNPLRLEIYDKHNQNIKNYTEFPTEFGFAMSITCNISDAISGLASFTIKLIDKAMNERRIIFMIPIPPPLKNPDTPSLGIMISMYEPTKITLQWTEEYGATFYRVYASQNVITTINPFSLVYEGNKTQRSVFKPSSDMYYVVVAIRDTNYGFFTSNLSNNVFFNASMEYATEIGNITVEIQTNGTQLNIRWASELGKPKPNFYMVFESESPINTVQTSIPIYQGNETSIWIPKPQEKRYYAVVGILQDEYVLLTTAIARVEFEGEDPSPEEQEESITRILMYGMIGLGGLFFLVFVIQRRISTGKTIDRRKLFQGTEKIIREAAAPLIEEVESVKKSIETKIHSTMEDTEEIWKAYEREILERTKLKEDQGSVFY